MRITFLGACRQITGSSTLVESGSVRILVDCGLYQERAYLARNWDPTPVPPESIDALLVTHVHLDHAGLIPKLVRDGFSGPILLTSASQDLLPIVLEDSARVQEEDAAFKKKRHRREKRKGRFPEVPLYTVKDVEKTLPLLRGVGYEEPVAVGPGLTAVYHDAGHILGSAMIELKQDSGRKTDLIFSGDIGQRNKPIVKDPTVFRTADAVVMESLYGDRVHEEKESVGDRLADVINRTVRSGGNIIIPTFAVERAQELLYHLSRLSRQDRIPYLMTFLDSPMAADVTDTFLRHRDSMDLETRGLFEKGEHPFQFPGLRFTRHVAESKAINSIRGSCIIMAGSGMCTGGRVKHHLAQNISRPESTILFVGYQAEGTLGRQILGGAPEVRIHGRMHAVKARVESIEGFSAHADREDLVEWIGSLQEEPRRIFLNHGEEEAARNLARLIRRQTGWETSIPEYLQSYDLD